MPALPLVEFELDPDGWHKAHILYQLGRKSYYWSKATQHNRPDGEKYSWFPIWSGHTFVQGEHEHVVDSWNIFIGRLVVE